MLVWAYFHPCCLALNRRLEANPNDAEAQNEIAEIIRMEAVQENMLSAMEHHPEAFGQVHRVSHLSKSLFSSGSDYFLRSCISFLQY